MSPQSALELAVGPFLVLVCVACILFGVFTTQVYYYWLNYETDGWKIKSFVSLVWVMEALHSSFCIHVLYFYFIVAYGNPVEGVNAIIWSVPLTVILEIAIVSMTEGFYIRRIWYLSNKNMWITMVPTLLLAARVAVGVLTIIYLYKYPTWANFLMHREAAICLKTGLGFGLAADVVITSLLIYFLRIKRTKFARTNRRLQKLMHYTINTGAITILVSATIIGTISVEGSLLFGGFVEVISKLYANSMLAMLNARKHIRYGDAGFADCDAMEFTTTSMHSSQRNTQVKIMTETSVSGDIPMSPRTAGRVDDALANYKSFDGPKVTRLDDFGV